MLTARSPGKDVQMRKMLADGVHDLQCLGIIVRRQDEELRARRPRGVEQVESRSIAIEALQPKPAQRFNLVRIVIEHGGAETIRPQKAADDVPETPEPGEDNGVVMLIDLIRGPIHDSSAVPG